MKDLINTYYYDALKSLRDMRLSDMSLKERIKYERALLQFEFMKRVLDKHDLQQK